MYYTYYLDDDSKVHPNLFSLLISVGYIDTAMVIIPFNSCRNKNGN